MRQELQKFDGVRRRFKGTFVRLGQKKGFKHPLPTVLLEDITDVATGKVVTGHLWFNLTLGFQRCELKEGEMVEFDARCKEYTKGYKGHRYDDEDYLNEHPIEADYKLSHPTNFRKRMKQMSGAQQTLK